ncbi:MAG: acyl-CoA carboxylase subunit beta [Lachnospiraceae bacterium]|nr:acyl-CoA carboxylase subunit beta [Lachnospiraceae bacterium]
MWNEKIEKLKKQRILHAAGGGTDKIEQQHNKGKLTALERIYYLLDENSFTELNGCMETDASASSFGKGRIYPGDGVITGWGMVQGRRVCIAAEDFTVIGGTLGVAHAKKIAALQDLALTMKLPILFLNDSGGARIEEGINALSGYGEIFQRHVKASGVIPQICAILGPCSGGACYSPALCDFIFCVKNTSKMFITGPAVVESVLGSRPTLEELGGADMHSTTSGVVHALYDDEVSCLLGIRTLLSYLPANHTELPPSLFSSNDVLERYHTRPLEEIVPDNSRKAYDMHQVIDYLTDDVPFFEIQKHFAKNAITGFAYLNRQVIGVVANQPLWLGGSLDCDSSDKIARFIRFCDCFHIPLLTLVDVPAFFPGKEQEQKGIIRHGAKILYAYSEAVVPKITLIMRKAYGGAYIAMNSKTMGADLVYAWPIAEIAVMGAEGAVGILYKKQLAGSSQPKQEMERLRAEYEASFLNPDIAEKKGFVDEVILPGETRGRLIRAFEFLSSKQTLSDPSGKRHGNIPL